MMLRGRFNAAQTYTCRFTFRWRTGPSSSNSSFILMAADVVNTTAITCGVPFWEYGFATATISVLRNNLPFWQKVCISESCGYLNFLERQTGSTDQVWSFVTPSFALPEAQRPCAYSNCSNGSCVASCSYAALSPAAHGSATLFHFTMPSSIFELNRNSIIGAYSIQGVKVLSPGANYVNGTLVADTMSSTNLDYAGTVWTLDGTITAQGISTVTMGSDYLSPSLLKVMYAPGCAQESSQCNSTLQDGSVAQVRQRPNASWTNCTANGTIQTFQNALPISSIYIPQGSMGLGYVSGLIRPVDSTAGGAGFAAIFVVNDSYGSITNQSLSLVSSGSGYFPNVALDLYYDSSCALNGSQCPTVRMTSSISSIRIISSLRNITGCNASGTITVSQTGSTARAQFQVLPNGSMANLTFLVATDRGNGFGTSRWFNISVNNGSRCRCYNTTNFSRRPEPEGVRIWGRGPEGYSRGNP